MNLRDIVNRPETPGGGVFAICVQTLIVLSLVAFSIETLPGMPAHVSAGLRVFEVFTIAAFTVEYLLRVSLAERPWKFITSFFGVIDLIAILPFYLSTGLDLRSVRVFRLLRLFRVFKLVRYSRAARRYHRAFVLGREELVLFGCASLIVLYLSAVGVYFFENPVQPDVFRSVFHSLWWAVITLTTVGYGDMVPVTIGGRFFTFIILVIGIGVIAVPTAIVSGALARARDEEATAEELE